MPIRDVGLQKERTQLAWGRSALGVTTLLLLLIKLGIFSSFQLIGAVLVLRVLLGSIAARKNELASTDKAVNRRTVMRHLSVSLTVMLAGVWFLLS
ncbi:hypothetical protein Z042_07760 [Chania multitudinisentens RB-25]|uniref:DUF202 domain-containing protein n=1 Tax=Chania multitudinisentens RB-25 TaxID=1441930 RepID=W0LB76_9GAMM|nr:DUF202 domain-containing protein [Chania multitudinisentens]AHG19517.2 hypothetical protein Z042_07760 [Chania multitudinisentens RB-25]